MGLDKMTLAAAKRYTMQSLEGAGAIQGKPGKDGENGKSAYEIAKDNGFIGTEQEWIISLNGKPGNDGNGIVSITKESSTGKVDTYKILFTDNTTTTFTVTNATTVTDLSQLNNDTEFITNTVNNLVNYYTKANTYSKDEIGNLLQNIGAGLSVMVVSALPTENISATTIYLVDDGIDNNSYEQWMYIAGQWASLGSTTIDLSAYYTKNDIDTLLLGYVTTSSLTTILADYVKKTELASVATSGSYNDLKDLPTIPTIEGLATEKYVDDAISNIPSGDGESVDLSNYYKKTDIDITMSDTSENPVQNKVIKKYVDEKSVDVSTEDNNALQEKTDGLYVKDLTGEFDKLNISQKTVNEVGSVSLLKNPVVMSNIKAPTTSSGSAVVTTVGINVALTDDISNYDILEISFRPHFTGFTLQPQTTSLRVNNILYNPSDTINNSIGTTLGIDYEIAASGSYTGGTTTVTIEAWFKSASILRLNRVYCAFPNNNPQTWEITDIIGIKDRSVTIDPVEYVNTENGIEDTPVGHVIAHMGNTAPKHYLICDGTEYNIVDYPHLAQHFKDEFGSTNYFGGNGTTTFAVPDLRGEFLRGSGDNSHIIPEVGISEGSGENVGVHQGATITPSIGVSNDSGTTCLYVQTGTSLSPGNIRADTLINSKPGTSILEIKNKNENTRIRSMTSRPTNTSVLYCIKYEPTYFMKIEGKDVYSTEERMIGYWIDGKPLYKKTIPIEITNVTGVKINKDIKQLNIDNIISIIGNAKSSKNIIIFIPYNDSNGNEVRVLFNNGVLQLYFIGSTTYIGNIAYITIEYTKTTD